MAYGVVSLPYGDSVFQMPCDVNVMSFRVGIGFFYAAMHRWINHLPLPLASSISITRFLALLSLVFCVSADGSAVSAPLVLRYGC